MTKKGVARGVVSLLINLHDDRSVFFYAFVYLGRVIAIRDKERNGLLATYVRGLRWNRLDHYVLRNRAIKARVRVIFSPSMILRFVPVVRVDVRGFLYWDRQAPRCIPCTFCLLQVDNVGHFRRHWVVCRGRCFLIFRCYGSCGLVSWAGGGTR